MKYPIRLNTELVEEAAHRIPGHPKCGRLHGHSYRISIAIGGMLDRRDGMLVDFGVIKKLIRDKLDHRYLNEFLKFPSAENMARYFALKIFRLNKVDIHEVAVTVYETESSCATSVVQNDKVI